MNSFDPIPTEETKQNEKAEKQFLFFFKKKKVTKEKLAQKQRLKKKKKKRKQSLVPTNLLLSSSIEQHHRLFQNLKKHNPLHTTTQGIREKEKKKIKRERKNLVLGVWLASHIDSLHCFLLCFFGVCFSLFSFSSGFAAEMFSATFAMWVLMNEGGE